MDQEEGVIMQVFVGNKYALWISVLLSVAVLQGIAISRDQYVPDGERPYLSATEDFSFLRNVEPENMKMHPVTLLASLEEDANTYSNNALLLDAMKPEFEEPPLIPAEVLTHEAVETPLAERKPTPLLNQPGPGEGILFHGVKRGENLSKIAKSYDLPINRLVLLNGITDPDHIYPGYQLRISFDKVFSHTVKEGETLWSISQLYGVSVPTLRGENQFKMDRLLAGQKITVKLEDLSEKGIQRVILARKMKSRFTWPLKGRISDPMGWRIHPITQKRNYHKGVDIVAPIGTLVQATDRGKVSFSGSSKGYGKLVILRHNGGFTSRYAHLSILNVGKGDWVARGQLIGEVGSTGVSTGPHLHFEIRKKGKVIDPISLLSPLPGHRKVLAKLSPGSN
jgi:LysM repeat protein